MNLYIYQNFSNYFNKKIKRFETLAKYGAPYFVQANVNFKPNDGVNTTLTVGAKESYDGSGDYLIVVNDDNTINSRWFILDQSRNREGQFAVTLRRDLISDFYESVMNDSTIYLEKGWINNLSNPLLFNDEGFKPNQIKKNETLIMDKSKCKWLIGYVDKKAGEGQTFWNGEEMRTNVSSNLRYDLSVNSWGDWDLYNFVKPGGEWKSASNIYTTVISKTGLEYTANKNGYVSTTGSRLYANTFAKNYVERYDEIDPFSTKLGADMTNEQYERLLALDGKTVYSVYEQEYLHISAYATIAAGKSNEVSITASNSPIVYAALQDIADSTDSTFKAYTYYNGIVASSIAVSSEYKNYKWLTNKTGHAHVINEAYDIFAIPIATNEAGVIRLWKGNEFGYIQADENTAYITAQALIEEAASGGYDLQLVPFAPLEDNLIQSDSSGIYFDVQGLEETFDYSIIYTLENIAYGTIFWLTQNSFSHAIEDVKIDNYTTVEELKAANQLDVYFLNSGDYSSSFEFSPARNRGVSRFIVDCTYKPYHPYIRVCPFFNPNGLYGQDWNDTRGLICSGTNFSVSRGSSAWETFERNNLNYQNAWKREIDYMDTMHAYDRANQIIGASTGALGAGVGVGIATARAGVGIGAGILSAGAGVADILISEQQYQLNRDNQIAARNENLANIKAQPNTLAATGANTKNNKIFPILTYYSCTDIERELFNLQLENYGLTVNCIVTNLNDYLNDDTTKSTYIKGQLIRLENINEDNHLVYEIAQELMRGIYLKGVNE